MKREAFSVAAGEVVWSFRFSCFRESIECVFWLEVVFLLASRRETKLELVEFPEAACMARRFYRKCPDCSSRSEVVFLLVSRREAKLMLVESP